MVKNKTLIPVISKFLHVMKADGPIIALKRSRAFFLGYDPDFLTVEYPISIQLSLNKTCNLHCIFCARQTKQIRKNLAAEENLVMPVEFLKENLTLFERADYVNISADGEPLLHPEIKKIFTLLNAAAQKPNITFVTNGVLLNKELIELIVKSQIMEIHFSIDSLTQQNLDFMRPGVDIDSLITNIETINRTKKKNASIFPRLVLRPTFISRTIEELPLMVDFCHKYGFSGMIVQQMQIYKQELSQYSLVHCKDLVKKNINAAIKRGKQLGIAIILDTVISQVENQSVRDMNNALAKVENPVTAKNDMKVSNLRRKCNLPWEYMLIQTNGDVYPCCHSPYLLGNLQEQTWKEIWNGHRAMELRKKFIKNILPKECVNQPCGIGKTN